MATFWELVQQNSSAPPGSTLWEHLNSQEGAGSHPVFYKEIEMEIQVQEVTIDIPVMEIEIDEPTIEIEIDEPVYTVEIE